TDSGLSAVYCVQQSATYIRDGPVAIDLIEYSPAAVVLDDRRRLPEVDIEPMPRRLDRVIFALVELAAAAVAFPGHRGRVEDFVIGRLTLAAQPSATQAAQKDISGNREVDGLIHPPPLSRERTVER